MTRRQTRRTLEHWTPDVGTLEAWLARKPEEGWVPEYPWDPPEVSVNGRQVWAVALINSDSFARGLGYRKPSRA